MNKVLLGLTPTHPPPLKKNNLMDWKFSCNEAEKKMCSPN